VRPSATPARRARNAVPLAAAAFIMADVVRAAGLSGIAAAGAVGDLHHIERSVGSIDGDIEVGIASIERWRMLVDDGSIGRGR
jgi:hypothetical protein